MTRLFVRPRTPNGVTRDTSPRRLIGAFSGVGPAALDRAAAMEEWLSIGLDVQTVFEPWDRTPDGIAAQFDRLTAIYDAGRTPLFTWEAYTPTPAATPPDVLQRIVNGEYDEYIDRWGSALAEWIDGSDSGSDDDRRRLLLRPLHEPNGDWYPWAPAASGGGPALYARVWRRLHRRLDRVGVPDDRVAWVWAVNHADVGDVPAESLFPGDDVVDLIGVDGFNWGASQPWSEWAAPDVVFGGMFDRVRAISKRPISVPEFGCTTATLEGPDPERKGAWLYDAFSYFADQDVVLAAYFDIEKETDWQVFGGSRGANTIRIDGTRYQTCPRFRRGIREFSTSLDTEA